MSKWKCPEYRREYHRAYLREWRLKNATVVRESARDSYLRRKEKRLAEREARNGGC